MPPPPPEKRENMLQNLCVLDPASTGTAESSGGAKETQLQINMGQ